jgi:TolB protein
MKKIYFLIPAVIFLLISCAKKEYKIAFVTARDGGYNIYTMCPDGRLQQKITDSDLADAPSWSPDRKRIAYVDDTYGYRIYLMNSDGTDKRPITGTGLLIDTVRWSPDGKLILFCAGSKDMKSELYTINTDGKNLKRLTNDDFYDIAPCWSPDGKKIAFIKITEPNGKVFVMDADGGNVRQITEGPFTYYPGTPSWSPDGRYILFSRSYEFFLIKPDGSGEQKLKTEAMGSEAVWSPDGKQIAYRSMTSDELFVMNADGSNPVNITNSYKGNYQPAW